jgi:ATPase subunit of ABC transporter with duplicated ATPase domains
MIRLESVCKQHSGRILFLDASMAVFRGEKIGLVGPNGAGKSTIFRMIVREEEPDSGSVLVEKRVSIGYFSQSVGEMGGRTVLEETIAGAGEVATVAHELHELELAMADPARQGELDRLVTRFGDVQHRFDELDGYGLESRAREILTGLGFAPAVVEHDVGELSGGWKMRTALARILLMKPDALLLDEPTNHLDLATKDMLTPALADFDGTMIFVSHDRSVLRGLSNRVLEIGGEDGPRQSGGGYAEYVTQMGYEAPGMH